jgi:hypothetical protein
VSPLVPLQVEQVEKQVGCVVGRPLCVKSRRCNPEASNTSIAGLFLDLMDGLIGRFAEAASPAALVRVRARTAQFWPTSVKKKVPISLRIA